MKFAVRTWEHNLPWDKRIVKFSQQEGSYSDLLGEKEEGGTLENDDHLS